MFFYVQVSGSQFYYLGKMNSGLSCMFISVHD